MIERKPAVSAALDPVEVVQQLIRNRRKSLLREFRDEKTSFIRRVEIEKEVRGAGALTPIDNSSQNPNQ